MIKNYIEIKTDRLLLRPINMSDLDDIHEYAIDEENSKYMMFLPNKSKEETIGFINYAISKWEADVQTSYEFAVVLGDKVIGAISLSDCEDKGTAELGWVLNPRYQGKGYATEAALAIKDFAIKNLNKLNGLKYKKLIAHCDYRNEPSYRLMEKIGMALEDDTGTRTYKGDTGEYKELLYSYLACEEE